jgi:4-hydroxyphenylpyruvate dioxygenase
MAWRVVDAQIALKRALDLGAKEYTGSGKVLDVPAVYGIGGSLLYFVDTYGAKGSPYEGEFEWLGEQDPKPFGVGFYYLDHLTHNVVRGNMDTWYKFYAETFKFREIRYFDISGKMTGLTSRALTSPDGKIRIPINESSDDKSQIEEYLREYKGEGIQHIAVASENIYESTDAIAAKGMEFMPGPPDTYYEMSSKRVKGHQEPLDKLKKRGILIDGEGVVDGGTTRILLQIFSKTVIGPIFFEFIQRKGDDGFGEGNFKALFESIEEDQIRRGVLKSA